MEFISVIFRPVICYISLPNVPVVPKCPQPKPWWLSAIEMTPSAAPDLATRLHITRISSPLPSSNFMLHHNQARQDLKNNLREKYLSSYL